MDIEIEIEIIKMKNYILEKENEEIGVIVNGKY